MTIPIGGGTGGKIEFTGFGAAPAKLKSEFAVQPENKNGMRLRIHNVKRTRGNRQTNGTLERCAKDKHGFAVFIECKHFGQFGIGDEKNAVPSCNGNGTGKFDFADAGITPPFSMCEIGEADKAVVGVGKTEILDFIQRNGEWFMEVETFTSFASEPIGESAKSGWALTDIYRSA